MIKLLFFLVPSFCLGHRFNFASSDCAARIIASSPNAIYPSALLTSNKDTYLRNLCATPNKFVVVELCQDIKPDTLVLINYEMFASNLKDLRVSLAKRLIGPNQADWRVIGEFEAKDVRGEQSFNLERGRESVGFFGRYIKVEFLSHYGNEYYCPISGIRIYGKTMIDDFEELKMQEKPMIEVESLRAAEETLQAGPKIGSIREASVKEQLLSMQRHLNQNVAFEKKCIVPDDIIRLDLKSLGLASTTRDLGQILEELGDPVQGRNFNESVLKGGEGSEEENVNIFQLIDQRLKHLESIRRDDMDKISAKIRKLALSRNVLQSLVEGKEMFIGDKPLKDKVALLWKIVSGLVLLQICTGLLVGFLLVKVVLNGRTIIRGNSGRLKRLPLTSLKSDLTSPGKSCRRLHSDPKSNVITPLLSPLSEKDFEPHSPTTTLSSPTSLKEFDAVISTKEQQAGICLNEELTAPLIVEATFELNENERGIQ